MSAEVVAGRGDVLLLCDHASNAVPAGIDLGIDPALLDTHIAIDIGAASVTRGVAEALGAPAVLGGVSRLVIDFNRRPDQSGLVPVASDGCDIPGNRGADVADRLARFHEPYHRAVRREVVRHRARLIVAIHSFTPRLEQGAPPPRRWEVGVLHSRDGGAARPALEFLRREALIVGDNEPYSGAQLNATLDRHAGSGIAAISIEIRNDLIRSPSGVARWCDIIARMIVDVRNSLAQNLPPAT